MTIGCLVGLGEGEEVSPGVTTIVGEAVVGKGVVGRMAVVVGLNVLSGLPPISVDGGVGFGVGSGVTGRSVSDLFVGEGVSFKVVGLFVGDNVSTTAQVGGGVIIGSSMGIGVDFFGEGDEVTILLDSVGEADAGA